MKICRKTLSVLLAVLMLALTGACLLPTAGAVTQLRDVNVTVSPPIIGQHPSSEATLPADAHCVVKKLEWWPSENYAEDTPVAADAVFADQVYILRIWLRPKTGYALPGSDGHESAISVNGTAAYVAAYNTATGEVEYRTQFRARTDNCISELEIYAPIPVIGEIPDASVITTTPGFVTLSKVIQVYDGQKWVNAISAYRVEEVYRVRMLFAPIDCYTYADEITVTVNGESINVGRSGENYLVIFSLQSPAAPQPPETPEEPPVLCAWCGKVHGKTFFEKIKALIHSLLAGVFGKRFK